MATFHEGDVAIRFELTDDGVRAFRTTVAEVGDGFVVDATGRRHEFDELGESPDLMPMDDIIAMEFKSKGDGFQVVHEEILQELDGPEVEGYGYER